MRFLTLHYWSLVLGMIAPLVPLFLYIYIEGSKTVAGFALSIGPGVAILDVGQYALPGLGTLGCLLSLALWNWPERKRYRFAFGLMLGTLVIVTALLFLGELSPE